MIVIGTSSLSFKSVPQAVYVFKTTGAGWRYAQILTLRDNGVNATMTDLVMENGTAIAGLPGITGAPGKAYVFNLQSLPPQ